MKKTNKQKRKNDSQEGNGIPVLFIGSNKKEATWAKEELRRHGNGIFEVTHASDWREAILELGSKKPEIIVIHYHQDFAEDVDATARIHAYAPDIPILVIGRAISTEIELQSIHAGAQNYLRREDIDGSSFMREILYSFARQHRVNKVHVLREVFHQKDIKKTYKKNVRVEALSSLWDGITHDFNNIIGSIYGYAELAQELMENPEQEQKNIKEHLDSVMVSAEKGRKLIEQIAMLGGAVKEEDQNQFDVGIATREAINFLKSTVPSSVKITTDIDMDAGNLKGEVTSFFHIIVNLGLEACNHIQGGKGTLHVELRVSDRCWLHDNEKLPCKTCVALRITSTTDGVKEAGIILPRKHVVIMPKKLAVFLRDMRVVLRKWEGSFMELEGELCLPFLPVAKSPEEAYPCQMGKGERLLLVEDDPNLSEAGRRMLERSGFQVNAFTDSRKALQSFLEDPSRYDLVITDYMMPDLSGKEMVEAMNNARRNMPVIMSTGYMTRGIENENFCGTIRKPYKKKDLLEAIRKALSQAHE